MAEEGMVQGSYPELPAEAAPRDGWVDVHDVLANPTPEELAEGQLMGEQIDTEDDDDNGGVEPVVRADNDRAAAVDEARKLKRALLAAGVPEVSIELLPGRPNEYGNWDALYAVADMSHHVVSRLGANLTPVLALVKKGRSDLPGPLANGYGGWDLCFRIITMGYANHPGEGGPIRVPTTNGIGYTIPQDSARRYAFGTEYEGGLVEADWDKVLRNPRNGKRMTMREFMDRANAGIQEYLNIPVRAHLEHSTWAPGRKIDRLNISADEGAEGLRRYRAAEPVEPTEPTEPSRTRVSRARGELTQAAHDISRAVERLQRAKRRRPRLQAAIVALRTARRALIVARDMLPPR
jgi:hypothetical protein